MKSLDASFFVNNREQAMKKLQGGLFVLAGNVEMQKTNDEAFRFAQDANMWYLTGIDFPGWWLIIDSRRGKSWLVEPDIDDALRLFQESLQLDDAKRTSGIDEVLSKDQAMSMLRTAARTHQLVYTVGPTPHIETYAIAANPAATDMKAMLGRMFAKVEDFRTDMARIRAIKQPAELEIMQSAIDLTVHALQDVKTKMHSYKYEYQIEADLSYAFRAGGAGGHAFDPIVASGASATVAHYFTNNSQIKKGSFVMMDIGARIGGYAADITRTYAAGKPTKRMQAVHDSVRTAQAEIISMLRPGLLFEEYYKSVDAIVKQKMVELNIIESFDDEKGYRKHFPYSVGHGLGVDVHDSLGKPRELQPGMVITVEPGIHIAPENIGVRIEDDILITATGHKNLSAKLTTDY